MIKVTLRKLDFGKDLFFLSERDPEQNSDQIINANGYLDMLTIVP